MKTGSDSFLRRVAIILVLACTSTIVIAATLHWRIQKRLATNTALTEARTLIELDVLNRYLTSRYGGFYVPTAAVPAVNAQIATDINPEVAQNGTLQTTDGRHLNLISHVEMTRQVYKLLEEHFGYQGHLTRLDSERAEGAPDVWEAAALRQFATGEQEVSAVQRLGETDYLRFIHVVRIDQNCLSCHAPSRFKAGEVFGGFSLTIPLAPFLAAQWEYFKRILISYLLLWIVGLLLVWYAVSLFQRQFAAIRDTESRREMVENSLHYLSHFDPATNLPNRTSFDDRLAMALLHADRRGEKVAVALVQISNFNQICNTFDHQVGDHLLRLTAERISQTLWPDDTIARFGKESILLLLPGLRARENVARIVNKISNVLEAPIEIEAQEAFARVKFGVALFPEDSKDAHTLVNYAETAVSRLVDDHRSTSMQMYSSELNIAAHEQLALETGLRKALREEQMEVYFQPQVDAPSGRIIGAEALLRWHHPEQGIIPPDRFIPIAENNGMIHPIGEWVLQNACRQAAHWQRKFGFPLRMGVNVSGRQFQNDTLIDIINHALDESGLPAESLEVEVTEGVVMEEIEKAIASLVDLKVRGVKVAIDDFGTGYSSLSQLRKLPFDRLKVDRSFLIDVIVDRDKQAIVEMIIELAARMNLEIISEGVETSEQMKFLISHGCYQMQGYLFGRPMTAEAFEELLAQNAAGRSVG